MNKVKGDIYELFVRNYIINTLDKPAYLWKDVPEKLLIEAGLIHSNNEHRLNRKKKKDTNENLLIDVGVDILQKDSDNFTLVQCKNGYNRGLTIHDLAGFYMMMMNHNHLNGDVYYTSKLSINITENSINKKVQYIRLPIEEQIYKINKCIQPYDYQIRCI